MFWKVTALSASSSVESVLDRENFVLEELLDEEEIIHECKSMNSRLINFLRERPQVEQLLQYIVEEPPEDSESRHNFKFPFVSCEILTCEIDVILRTLVEEEELMDLLFSFLEPNRHHSPLLAGYFGKVVVCLMMRKTIPLINYVQSHQDVFPMLVDLIGITSIMEVLVRLVAADDHVYPNFMDVMQWLSDSNLLEMIIDKLSPSCPAEVQANAAEILCAVSRNAPSALATKLCSPSFVKEIFGHALEQPYSKSAIVHSLSVCISFLDPKRSVSPYFHSIRIPNMFESPAPINQETVGAMLPKLGDLLMFLIVSSDENILPTTYGELRPPLGMHRLKIVEFIAVLLRTGSEVAERELVCSGTIRRVIDLLFEYPYNSSLHHHVESIISSCLESKSEGTVNHLFVDCDLIRKILQLDKHPNLSGDPEQPTLPCAGRWAPRVGNLGHITRISNKLVQLGDKNFCIQSYLQENCEWGQWQATVLQERNHTENVYQWACGRPTALQDRTQDSDDDDIHSKDYDVSALANNLSQAFSYNMHPNENAEEKHETVHHGDEDAYFEDESAEVVASSLRLGDDHGSLFTNSNWFAFQDDRIDNGRSELMDDIDLNGTATSGDSSSDDEVVVGGDEELECSCGTSSSQKEAGEKIPDSNFVNDKAGMSGDAAFFQLEAADNDDLFGDRPLPDWVAWGDSGDLHLGGSSRNPFEEANNTDASLSSSTEQSVCSNGVAALWNGCSSDDERQRCAAIPLLFEEDVEFVGVELGGTEKAMEQAMKGGTDGEAMPLKNVSLRKLSDEGGAGMKEFNDANYWKVDQEVAVLE